MRIDRIPEWELTPDLEAGIARLLAVCFPTDFGGRSYFQTRHHLRLVYRPEGVVRGHMALQFRSMRLGGRLITVAGLAEVATDPDFRGQGVAATILQAAIAEVRASPAEALMLFGVARLYAAAGFRKVANPMIWADMLGAETRAIRHDRVDGLMVLPLRGQAWDETATLDMLGSLF